jgi:hypothetical protein
MLNFKMSLDSDEDTNMHFKGASIGMEQFYGFLEKLTSRKPKSKLRDSSNLSEESSTMTELN